MASGNRRVTHAAGAGALVPRSAPMWGSVAAVTTPMPPTLASVVGFLDDLYPPAWAEEWDRVGLVVGEPDARLRRMLCVVDCVPQTVAEAIRAGADLILAHHPLLLRGVSSVATTTYKGRIVHDLIRHEIALYTAHTNADVAAPGVSDALAARLRLSVVRAMRTTPTPQRRWLMRTSPPTCATTRSASTWRRAARRCSTPRTGPPNAPGWTSRRSWFARRWGWTPSSLKFPPTSGRCRTEEDHERRPGGPAPPARSAGDRHSAGPARTQAAEPARARRARPLGPHTVHNGGRTGTGTGRR